MADDVERGTLPRLVTRKCMTKGCKHTWRTLKTSEWNYCSRRCAIEDGALRKDQEFRDHIALTFIELSFPDKRRFD